MSVVATIEADESAELRDLFTWLREDPELRAWVELMEGPPPEGRLGPIAEALQVVVDSPEVVAAVTSVIIAWLRYRRSDVKIKIRHSKTTSEVDVTVSRIKGLDSAQMGALTGQIKGVLSGGSPALSPGDPPSGASSDGASSDGAPPDGASSGGAAGG